MRRIALGFFLACWVFLGPAYSLNVQGIRANDAEVGEKEKGVGAAPIGLIFYTPETVNVAMLKKLLQEADYKDSRIYRVTPTVPLERFFEMAKGVVQKHDVRFVREFVEESPFIGEAWYYGLVSETKEETVIRVTLREKSSTLGVFVACSNLSSLTGLLAELGNEMNGSTHEQELGTLEPSTDPAVQRRLNRLALLLDRYGDSNGTEREEGAS